MRSNDIMSRDAIRANMQAAIQSNDTEAFYQSFDQMLTCIEESIKTDYQGQLAAMQADSGIPLNTLRVDGGASANNYLMQTQADIINAPVARPRCVETTAMGAAFLAGLAVKYWADTEEIKHSRETEREFYPSISEAERGARTAGWNRAVKCAYGWAKE